MHRRRNIVMEEFICDGCGKFVFDEPIELYDENYEEIDGCKYCFECAYGIEEE